MKRTRKKYRSYSASPQRDDGLLSSSLRIEMCVMEKSFLAGKGERNLLDAMKEKTKIPRALNLNPAKFEYQKNFLLTDINSSIAR